MRRQLNRNVLVCAMAALSCALGAVPAARAQQALSLQDAIALAQRQSLQARAAVSGRDASRARDRAAGAILLPQVALSGTAPLYNRAIVPVVQPDGSTLFLAQTQNQSALTMRVSQQLPYVGGQLFFASALSRLQVIGENSTQNWSSTPMQIGIQQEIGRPNIAAWNAEERDLNADIGERQYFEAREDVAISTAAAFFDYYAAKLSLANAVNNAAVNDSLYTLNKGRYEVGKIGENDLQQSELALLRARISLDGAKLELDRSLAALRVQLNLPVGVPVDVAVSAAIPEFTPDTTIAVAQAVRNSSQTRLLDFSNEQARRRVSEARYNTGIGATVSASVGFNQTGGAASQVYQNLLQAQQYSLQVQIPLVQWGGRSAQIEAARADQDRVTSNGQLQREQIVQDAHFAALGLSLAARQLTIAAKADTVASNRFEVAKNRYLIGKIGIDNLVVAQTDKDSALLAYVQSLRGYWQAYYHLRRVTLYDFERGQPIR